MRFGYAGAVALVLMSVMTSAQARELNRKQIEMCRWGSEVARSAQHSKLSGTTLWRAREDLKTRKYPERWMPRMAVGITEQTYASRSRLQPASVKKTYYDGCIRHERNRIARR